MPLSLIDLIPDDIRRATVAALALVPTTFLGRLVWRSYQAIANRRRFWSADLLWELPTAFLCAICVASLAAYLSLPFEVANGLAGVAGWLGPRGMEVLVYRIKVGKDNSDA